VCGPCKSKIVRGSNEMMPKLDDHSTFNHQGEMKPTNGLEESKEIGRTAVNGEERRCIARVSEQVDCVVAPLDEALRDLEGNRSVGDLEALSQRLVDVQVLGVILGVTQVKDASVVLRSCGDIGSFPSDGLGRPGSPNIARLGRGDLGIENDVRDRFDRGGVNDSRGGHQEGGDDRGEGRGHHCDNGI